MKSVTDCLIAAAQKSVLVKTVELKGPKHRILINILGCLKKVKVAYQDWAAAGKPRSGHLLVENKMAKKYLLAHHLKEEAIRRKSLYDVLMENPTSKMFFKLFNRSKSHNKSNSTCIQVNNQKYSDLKQQRLCFSNYFKDLAMPKDKYYDRVFLELCNVRCEEAENHFHAK